MKLAIGILIVIAALVIGGCQIRSQIISSYRQEKQYGQFWSLADKSSTIPAKQKYLRQYVDALRGGYQNGQFASYDAVWLQTPNNSFEANLHAVETLADRLDQIQSMDITSFQYNTAIEQITKQEQGEASSMLHVFSGCYELSNYPIIWGWIGGITCGAWIVFLIVGIVTTIIGLDDF
jgi:hypothetical protein